MMRGLAVALATGFLAGGIGAQSLAPLPAYAAPIMIAPDSRGGVKDVPPLFVAGQSCYDEYKLDLDNANGQLIVCSGGEWLWTNVKLAQGNVTTGSPCVGRGDRAKSSDGYLNTCGQYTNVWVRGYAEPPPAPAPAP
jgi:hypothetical protein